MSKTTKICSTGKLKTKVDLLNDLCAEILGALTINLDRGTITSYDDLQLRELIAGWSKRRWEAWALFANWGEADILRAINASCSCGGKGPDDGCCQACEVWHSITGRWNKS